MSTLKKVLALTLALAMVMSLGVFAAFKDQTSINADCTSAVDMMNTLGIIKGDNKGNFNPTNTITRAEAAAMIFRLMNKGNDDASMYNGMKVFTDVPSGAWFEGYVNYAYTMGIVAGRTATTFDPSAPVTGYEIAKMLLTCLKYNAEKQGYTGGNWAKNVQNDAFAAGLLDDYGMALSLPAQRQWVAVMFNQTLNSYVARYYLGELTVDEKDENTLGYKNFGLETVKGILTAIQHAAVEGTVASTGYSTLKTTSSAGAAVYTEYKMVADKNLLGQQVNIIWNSKTEKVYGITATGKSKLGTAVLGDVGYDTEDPLDTSKFTVGSVTATAAAATTKVLYPNTSRVYTTAGAFYNYAGQSSNAPVRAVDTDNDGDFDYIMIDFSQYGTISVSTKGVVKFNGNTKTAEEVTDQINYVNTVANADFVKVTANPFTYKFDIEKMTSTTAIVNRIYTAGSKYSLGGTTYWVSDDADVDTTPFALSKSVDVYLDGSYIVNAAATTATATATMPTNMAMVIAKGTDTTWTTPVYSVKLMTTDGKISQYVYTQAATTDVAADAYNVGEIYQYVVNSDTNTVTLKYFYNSKITNSALAFTGTTVSGDALNTSVVYTNKAIAGALVASDAAVFVKYVDGSTTKYAVMKISDFGNGTAASGQTFTASVNGIKTVLCAVLNFTGNYTGSTTTVAKYVIAEGDSYVEYDGTYFYEKMKVMYTDGTEETLVLQKSTSEVTADGAKDKGTMWKINSVSSTGVSALTTAFATEIAAKADVTGASGSYVQIAGTPSDTLYTLESDCVIILKTITSDGSSFSKVTSIADLYASYSKTNEAKLYSVLKASVLTTVASGTNAGNVSMLYVEVTAR